VRRRTSWASSTRFTVPVLRNMFETCTLTVFSLTTKACDLRVGAASHDVRKDLALARREAGEDGAILGTFHGCHGGQRHTRAGCQCLYLC
jgi:hypothetical protein